MTLWPFVAILGLVWGIGLLRRLRVGGGERPAALVLCGLIVTLGVIAWPAYNIYRFKNPTYPLPSPISKFFQAPEESPELFRGALGQDVLDGQTPEDVRGTSRAGLFFYSAFEVSRFRHPERPFHWSLDSGADGGPTNPHFRMGGWSVWSLLLWLATLAWMAKRRWIPWGGIVLLAVAASVVLVLPESHELRYWLFVPLGAFGLIARGMRVASERTRLIVHALTLVLAVYTGFAVRREIGSLKPATAVDFAPAEAVKSWNGPHKKDWSGCVGKLPETIYWSGPDFNSFKVRDCY
jgi:hypothetical protein